jgi:hypothetical protein
MKSRRWKWIGLGAIAAIAVGSALVAHRRRQRRWHDYDTAEIRSRLHERFAQVDGRSEGGRP